MLVFITVSVFVCVGRAAAVADAAVSCGVGSASFDVAVDVGSKVPFDATNAVVASAVVAISAAAATTTGGLYFGFRIRIRIRISSVIATVDNLLPPMSRYY